MRKNELLLSVLVALVCTLARPAIAGQTELDGTKVDDRIYRAYDSNYRKFARVTCKNDAGYFAIPTYDRRLDNSRGLTGSQAREKLTKRWEETAGNLVVKKSKSPPREDAEAYATRLPDLKIGSYGWLHSAQVVEIIDENEMVVRELWLVNRAQVSAQYKADQDRLAKRNNNDADLKQLQFDYAQRAAMVTQQEDREEGFTGLFRLVGYDTRGLRVGDRWEGPNSGGFQVGVVKWETPEPAEDDKKRQRYRGDDDPRLVLSELESTMRQTLDEEGFKQLLAERDMTVVGFVDLVRTLRDRDRDNAEERIFNSLLAPERVDDK